MQPETPPHDEDVIPWDCVLSLTVRLTPGWQDADREDVASEAWGQHELSGGGPVSYLRRRILTAIRLRASRQAEPAFWGERGVRLLEAHVGDDGRDSVVPEDSLSNVEALERDTRAMPTKLRQALARVVLLEETWSESSLAVGVPRSTMWHMRRKARRYTVKHLCRMGGRAAECEFANNGLAQAQAL